MPDTSHKPIAEVYIDDRDWQSVKRKWSWIKVMKRMRKLFQPGQDTFIEAAEYWSYWPVRLLNYLRDIFTCEWPD